MAAYSVKTKVDTRGEPHSIVFPYAGGAEKHRLLAAKQFWAKGTISSAGLFGREKFAAGSAKAVTVTEGELDTLSAYQIFGSKYPVASVQSASTALRDCTKDYEWLNSFEKIYLCFDNDDPGEKAASTVAKLFGYSKVYIVKLQLKDANEYLQAGKQKEFINAWYSARRYLPDGVLSTFQDFREALGDKAECEAIPYPFRTLQEKTGGVHLGEVVLIDAFEGVGKTELMRAIEHSALKHSKHPVGIIHLEENKQRTLKGLAGLELKQPCHLDESSTSDEEVIKALEQLITKDDRLYIYSHYGSDDPDTIVEIIRFLVSACGCKYIFLDHITMLVTAHDRPERETLDRLSTLLAMLVEELNFALVMISHINDDGKTRGSRSISQIAKTRIHLSRDLEAESLADRLTTKVTIKKNRFRGGGDTGPAGSLAFNTETFCLEDRQQSGTM